MANKKICVSFDYEHDHNYYYLLEAWNKRRCIPFYMHNCTTGEIQTQSVATVKQVLSRRIGEANYMIAIIGKHSCDFHPDYKEIGYNNWQAYEIAKNNEKGNKLVVVRLNPSYEVPIEAYGVNAEWVDYFDCDKISEALDKLAAKY